MRKFFLAVLLLLSNQALLARQEFSSLEERMTGKEFMDTGLYKLSEAELRTLNDWLRSHSGEPGSLPSAAPAAPAGRSATDSSGAEADFGFPERSAARELEMLRSPILKVDVNQATRRHIFYLENGQVWEQAEGKQFLVPDGPLVAEITPGALNSYQLSFEGRKQWVRVKRLR